MVTKRKSELAKARGETLRAASRMVKALPMVARVNWRNIVMPWRMLPAPVALALIALVALAMVLDTGSDASATGEPPTPIQGQGVMVGGDTVAPGTRCAEDDVITYRVLMGGSGVGCVHYEYLAMDFLAECIIGTSETHPLVTPNLASRHIQDQSFGSWCQTAVDDVSDGIVTLADLLYDAASTVAVEPAIGTPTMTPTMTASPTMTATPMAPKSLPSTGSK